MLAKEIEQRQGLMGGGGGLLGVISCLPGPGRRNRWVFPARYGRSLANIVMLYQIL